MYSMSKKAISPKWKSLILYCICFVFSAGLLLYAGLTFLSSGNLSFGNSAADTSEYGYTISHDSGFYKRTIHVKIRSLAEGDIYYTTDGSEPSSSSSSSVKYEKPITFSSSGTESCHVLKFRLYPAEGQPSQVFEYTYFVGYFVDDRYSTYVVSISGDPDGLFGYENGIFVPGKLRDDYLKEHPEITEAYNLDPANYNLSGPESEREVHINMFDSNGSLLLSQSCGLRIFGNFSRGKEQKSFQLFARNRYDQYGKFDLSLFPALTNDVDGTMLGKDNRLVFRNSGNDFGQAFIRDTLIQELAGKQGFPMSTPYVPASVYINGEYYGFYWVKEPFNNGQMEELYGDYNGTFERVSINEFYKTAEDPSELLAEEYQEFYDRFAEADMTDDAVFEQLQNYMDLDNYITYYAMELYIANKDWPYNNVRAYRYVAEDDVYTPGTVFDGKYRYLFFDTDYGFGLSDDVPGFSVEEDNISVLLNNVQSPLFCNLMARRDCREKFVTAMCDLMNYGFSPASVEASLTNLAKQRDTELSYYVDRLLSDHLTMEEVQAATSEILAFAQNRPTYMHSFLQNDYAMFYPYTLQISAPEDVQISVNGIEDVQQSVQKDENAQASTNGSTDAGYTFQGNYYADCSLTLKAAVNEGHTFSHWQIGGRIYEEPEITLSSEEIKELLCQVAENNLSEIPTGENGESVLTYLGTLPVTMIETDNTDYHAPTLVQLHVKGDLDTVELCNLSDHEISLTGLYLSDQSEELKNTGMPRKKLAPGETIIMYGSNNVLGHSSGARLNFSLRKEETLYLSDENGTILESIKIPDMTREDTFYTKNLYTGKWKETLE